jgi:hypothetical protein
MTQGPDRHHNCFFYYRGPSMAKAGDEAGRIHQQVEDNTTKALINVLERSTPKVGRSFMERFSPDGVPAGEPLAFHLQRTPANLPRPGRALLGISVLGAIDPATLGADETGMTPRIDAAIELSDASVLLIEVKVEDYLDGHQLDRHAKGWALPADTMSLARWSDVWRWASNERGRTPDAVTGFLLGELCDYLEIVGLAPWAGFRVEDMDHLATAAAGEIGSPEQLTILKARMAGAWERVLDELEPEERKLLGTVRVGRTSVRDDHAWAQTNADESGANLSLELYGSELQLDLVGWTADQADAVAVWVSEKNGRLPSGAELIVFQRDAKPDRNGNPYWVNASYQEIRRFSVIEIADGAFPEWQTAWAQSTDKKWHALAYHVRRTRSRGEVLALGESLAVELVDDVRALLPALRTVNKWA